MNDTCDVLVVGGGPAGSTAATLLAQRGWQVVVLERDRHPRFHIGESLLPMNLPILERLGLLAEVDAIGVRKPGAEFTPEGNLTGHEFRFDRAFGSSPPHAYQVKREHFDELLLDGARRAGCLVYEAHEVYQVGIAANGTHRVSARHNGGETQWRCGYVIDATGRDCLLARQEHWQQRDRRHSGASVFAHYRGVTHSAEERGGNISVYWFDSGWIWVIPLADGLTSIGVVATPQFLRSRAGSLDELLDTTIVQCPGLAQRIGNAARTMPAQGVANYSYCSRRQIGAGFALVGDSYTFIDPVFSSGVYIAMSSGEAIVPCVELWLRGRRIRHVVASMQYRWRSRRGIRAFKWFIYRFTTPTMRLLFENPRNVLGVEQAVISMLAGDVFELRGLNMRLAVFKLIYAMTRLFTRSTSNLEVPENGDRGRSGLKPLPQGSQAGKAISSGSASTDLQISEETVDQ